MAQIDIPNLPSNSYKARAEVNVEEKKEVKERPKEAIPVVKGTVVRKEQSKARKAWIRFVGEDLPDVKDHFLDDVLFPAIRNMIFEGITDGLSMLLFHEVTRGRGKNEKRNYSSYSYSGRNRSRDRDRRDDYYDEEDRKKPSIDDVILSSRQDAENVLEDLRDYIDDYDQVSVAYYYGLCDVTPDYTDESWGWDSLKTANITHARGGYRINLPRPKPLS